MNFTPTNIPDVVIIKPRIFEDERGYFFESYNKLKFQEKIGDLDFVQDNESKSNYGVLRGLHYQLEPYAQAKLVSVPKGRVLDIAVDIRKGSPSYGEHVAVELSEENKLSLFIPKGFAHGFIVLSPEAVFQYKCDNFYNKKSEGGIRFDDPKLGIDWEIPHEDITVSEKDANFPGFDKARYNFIYKG